METWFKGGKKLKEELNNMEGASGIKFIHKSRDGRTRGNGGGVAIAYHMSRSNFK